LDVNKEEGVAMCCGGESLRFLAGDDSWQKSGQDAGRLTDDGAAGCTRCAEICFGEDFSLLNDEA